MTEPLVLGATQWRDNAKVVAAAFKVMHHHLPDKPECIDLTFGIAGLWWRDVPHIPTVYTGDFTAPTRTEADEYTGRFDVVALDPPYVLQGGAPKGKDPKFAAAQLAFRQRYGVDKPRNIHELRALIEGGCRTAYRFTKPGGFTLVKSMPFTTSGMVNFIPDDVTRWMTGMGAVKHDELVHLRKKGGPQPVHERQMSARKNYSYLHLYRKPVKAGPSLFDEVPV